MTVLDTPGVEDVRTSHFSQLHRNLYAEMFNGFYVTRTFTKFEVSAVAMLMHSCTLKYVPGLCSVSHIQEWNEVYSRRTVVNFFPAPITESVWTLQVPTNLLLELGLLARVQIIEDTPCFSPMLILGDTIQILVFGRL